MISPDVPPQRAAARTRVLVTLALLVALAPLAACTRRATETTIDAGRMGKARLFVPRERDGSVVVLLSDAGGIDRALSGAAFRLAESGVIVALIDLPAYTATFTKQEGCAYVVGDVEELAHRLEREQGLVRYRLPVVAGVGAGATLAYAALAQAPAATIAGAVGVDPAPSLATSEPICAGAPAAPVEGGGFAYGPVAELPGWWRVSVPAGAVPTPASPAVVETAAPGASSTDRLVALVSDAVGAEDDDAQNGLSVVEYPSESGSDVLAIIYSGDGGWRDLDKQIGEYLAARGLPVVGVDSLRSFWSVKTPEEMASDLADLMETYGERWGTKRVVLIGYSFGAGILPFAIDHLPAADRARIVLVSLLGVEPRADFEIHFTGWLGQEPDETAPEVLPALLQLDLSRVQCFYGEDEEGSLCRLPALAKAEVIRTSGGHHFDGDYDALAQRILDGIEKRAPGAVPPQPTATPAADAQ
jgi:type IV secretory pathway VirJ component